MTLGSVKRRCRVDLFFLVCSSLHHARDLAAREEVYVVGRRAAPDAAALLRRPVAAAAAASASAGVRVGAVGVEARQAPLRRRGAQALDVVPQQRAGRLQLLVLVQPLVVLFVDWYEWYELYEWYEWYEWYELYEWYEWGGGGGGGGGGESWHQI